MSRLFIAIDLPEDTKDALGDLQSGLADARWVDIDNLHLTLRFVGAASNAETGDLIEALATVSGPAVTIRFDGFGHFERRNRPTSLWISVALSPALGDLQRRIEAVCRAAGFAPETRRFTPHVTLARFGANGSAEAVGRWLEAAPRPQLAPFEAGSVTLFNSRLSAAGPDYEPVFDVALDTLPDVETSGWHEPDA